MRLTELPKHEQVADLLRKLADDQIGLEEFWEALRRYGLDDEDIHRFCCGEQVG